MKIYLNEMKKMKNQIVERRRRHITYIRTMEAVKEIICVFFWFVFFYLPEPVQVPAHTLTSKRQYNKRKSFNNWFDRSAEETRRLACFVCLRPSVCWLSSLDLKTMFQIIRTMSTHIFRGRCRSVTGDTKT